ncbi:MAG TPA: hypothetical protein VK157_03810 [Phycisphaerales bacterium]|nr:hypothetical protein [Phycisphaerales bacterium]
MSPTSLPNSPAALSAPAGAAWGAIATTSGMPVVLEKAQQLARKGKLPGFARTAAGFSFTGFGEPFDYVIEARTSDGGVSFHAAMHRKLPLIFAVIIVLSIWPGSWLTDSMLRSYFESYNFAAWVTYAWYIPLTVLPLLWMIPRMLRKSRQSAYAHACEQIETLRAALSA